MVACLCIAVWTAGALYWNSQYAGGCWCGSFANWVSADGLVHAVDAAKFEHLEYFTCYEHIGCVVASVHGTTFAEPLDTRSMISALRTAALAEPPGTHFAIFSLRAAAMAVAPLLLLLAAAGVAVRKKLVVSARDAADCEAPKKAWTMPLTPML